MHSTAQHAIDARIASGVLHGLAHSTCKFWQMLQEHELVVQLEVTPTAKMSTFAAFMNHVEYRVRCVSLFDISEMSASVLHVSHERCRALEDAAGGSGSCAGAHSGYASRRMRTRAMPSPTVPELLLNFDLSETSTVL